MPDSSTWVAVSAALGAVLHFGIGAVLTVHVLLHKRDVPAAIGWIGIGWFAPFIGALLGELASGNSMLRSTHVGLSAWLGLIFGTLIKLVSSLMMVALFGAAWWWNR